MRKAALGSLLAFVTGCAGSAPRSAVTALHYEANLRSLEPCVVDVDVDVEGTAATFSGVEPKGLVSVEVADAGGKRRPEVRGGAVDVDCRGSCRISYRYDLSRAAREGERGKRSAHERFGEVLVAATTWMLRPAVTTTGAPVDLAVHVPEGTFFTSGLRKAADGRSYTLRSEELPTLGFTSFGRTAPRTVKVTGGAVEVLVMPGKRAATDEGIFHWVAQSARVVEQVYRRFPMHHAAVFVAPYPGSESVDFGVTLPSGGASIAVLMGEDASDAALLEKDWVLSHEMLHLGVPSFSREEVWLNEGLATYYEPVGRMRAGLISPQQFWEQMARDMPRGVASDEPIAGSRNIDRIYWGSAFLAMRADVNIRFFSHGRRSLDDGLRSALVHGGNATTGATLSNWVDTLELSVGENALGGLVMKAQGKKPYCRDESTGSSVPPSICAADAEALERLFDVLGVRRNGDSVSLVNDAPLAWVRNAIGEPVTVLASSEIEPIPFAGAGDGRALGIVEVGVMNEPHSIADRLR